tara:strand:+ start:157 stop:537 length:381 start_codon:yes stop_codon:yes gene_type:complete
MNNNKLPKDFIVSDEYCVIEPGLTIFNKDQIISHVDLMKHLENNDINTLSVLPHMSDNIQTEEMTYEKLSEEVKKLLDNTEEKMIDLIDEYNLSIENKQYEYENEIDTVDLSNLFTQLNEYIEDYS